MRKKISFNSKVLSITFNEKKGLWKIQVSRKGSFYANFCVMATGCLSIPYTPIFKGLSQFQGGMYHTAKWPKNNIVFKKINTSLSFIA